MRKWLVGLSGVALVALPCWALAQERAGLGAVVEHDAVSARAAAERSASRDRDQDAQRREIALARARREAPFDLRWGIGR